MICSACNSPTCALSVQHVRAVTVASMVHLPERGRVDANFVTSGQSDTVSAFTEYSCLALWSEPGYWC